MKSYDYSQYLLNNIKPFAKIVSGGKEINCRCFYCPDSKDNRKGHFYIKTNVDGDEPSTYYCQKCHATGIVTQKKLLEWDIYDANLAIDITNHNKRILNNPLNRKYKDDYIYNVLNNYITDDKLSKMKLDYINNRLGLSLSYKDCLDMKIILNLMDFLQSNRIKEFTRHDSIVKQLDKNFIGFLSYDNAFINMRNLEIDTVYESINKRYINYNVFNKVDNSHRFYTIPNNINLDKPIKLHIAEGSFDILSIFYNLYNGDKDNQIFTSIGGSGYLGMIKFFISNKMLIDLEIHIYPDNDIEDYKLRYISNILKPFHYDIYIHRNIYPNEKDFGVPLDRIKENIERI